MTGTGMPMDLRMDRSPWVDMIARVVASEMNRVRNPIVKSQSRMIPKAPITLRDRMSSLGLVSQLARAW